MCTSLSAKWFLWAGHRNAARSLPWEHDTIVMMFSTCKPFATMAVLMLADRSLIDLDELVSAYWPEYAQAGKENTTVRHILTHRAGLPGLLGLRNGDLYNWDTIIRAIEAAAPLLPPGRTGCYHTNRRKS